MDYSSFVSYITQLLYNQYGSDPTNVQIADMMNAHKNECNVYCDVEDFIQSVRNEMMSFNTNDRVLIDESRKNIKSSLSPKDYEFYFREGQSAGDSGAGVDDNPYASDPDKSEAWLDGLYDSASASNGFPEYVNSKIKSSVSSSEIKEGNKFKNPNNVIIEVVRVEPENDYVLYKIDDGYPKDTTVDGIIALLGNNSYKLIDSSRKIKSSVDEIMNSKKINSSFDKTIFSKSPNDCRNEKISDVYFTVNGEPLELVFKMDSDWDRAYLNHVDTGAMIEIPENDKNSPLYQVIENLIGKPIEFDDLTLTDVYSAQQIESSKKPIKFAKNFAEKTPYDITLDNGKQIKKGTVFNVDYDRNEQGEYVLGISINGLGRTQLRFDSENDALKRGWIIESSHKPIKSGNIPAKGSDSEKLFAKISKKVPSARIKGNNEEGHYIEIPNDGKISENYLNSLSEYFLYDGYKVINDKIRIYFDEGDFGTYSIKSGNIYDYNNCSFCGDKASGTLRFFLERDGYDVETVCDILDIDPAEVVCENCYKSWKPELDAKMHSEYDDLGTDVRTGEPFSHSVENGFDRNKESLNKIF